jgi:hypothetical protein
MRHPDGRGTTVPVRAGKDVAQGTLRNENVTAVRESGRGEPARHQPLVDLHSDPIDQLCGCTVVVGAKFAICQCKDGLVNDGLVGYAAA